MITKRTNILYMLRRKKCPHIIKYMLKSKMAFLSLLPESFPSFRHAVSIKAF